MVYTCIDLHPKLLMFFTFCTAPSNLFELQYLHYGKNRASNFIFFCNLWMNNLNKHICNFSNWFGTRKRLPFASVSDGIRRLPISERKSDHFGARRREFRSHILRFIGRNYFRGRRYRRRLFWQKEVARRLQSE